MTDTGAHSHPAPDFTRVVTTQDVSIRQDNSATTTYTVTVPSGNVVSGSYELVGYAGYPTDNSVEYIRVVASKPHAVNVDQWVFTVTNRVNPNGSGKSWTVRFHVVSVDVS